MDETNWPPRFTFTARGLAGLYLRKHFGDRADGADVGELASLIEKCADKAKVAEREACVDAIQRLIDGGLNCHAVDCIAAIRLRGAAL